MLSCSVVGSPATVQRGLEAFVARTGADELMVASQIYDHDARLRSYELAAAPPALDAPRRGLHLSCFRLPGGGK